MDTTTNHASSLESHWRFKQSLLSQPLNDVIYKAVLRAKAIVRATADNNDMALDLDIKHGIDAKVTIPHNLNLTVQEKALSHEYEQYNSVTIEYEQDANAGTLGDWANCKAELLLIGYLSEDKSQYTKWALINLTTLKLAMCRRFNQPLWSTGYNTKDGARASFKYIECNRLFDFVPECFVAQENMLSVSNTEILRQMRLREIYPDHDDFAEAL